MKFKWKKEKKKPAVFERDPRKKIPSPLLGLLQKQGIQQEDIAYAAFGDMSDGYGYADSVLLLTSKQLILAQYPEKASKVQLGGYIQELAKEQLQALPALRYFALEEIEKTEVLREISSGVLVLRKSGVDYRLVRFSNSRMGSFLRLSTNLEKLKNGETLGEDDVMGSRAQECCPQCGTMYPDQERKVCPKCTDKKSIFMRMLRYFTCYPKKLIVMFFCFLGMSLFNLVWPYLSGTILYDKVLKKNEAFAALFGDTGGEFVGLLLGIVMVMFFAKLMQQLLGIIQGVLVAQIVPNVLCRLKEEIFASLGRLSIRFFNSRQTGGLMTRVLDDTEQVASFYIDGLPYCFVNGFMIIAMAVVMFRLQPVMAVACLCTLPILSVISYKLSPILWSYYGRRHRANRSVKGRINDNLTGARVVKAFGQEAGEWKRFDKASNRLRHAELDVAAFDVKFSAIYILTENLISFLAWSLGAYFVLTQENFEVGLVITFTGYIAQLKGPLDFFSYLFRWAADCMNSCQRIFEIIDAVPEITECEDPVRPQHIAGEIELRNVTFGYEPNKPILKDISFHVEAGQMLGIVGRSGAGKSTLVNLISRLYDPDEGEIYIDGIDVRKMGFAELRKSIAMVSQETYIFSGTVYENIAYARPDATHEEVIMAAIQASAHDFICKMPDGYDTKVGVAGRSLSGGERQRISIARAILANPRILILDEATAAVDTETELAIQESLERLVKGRTTLSIAHRLSTLRNADTLIVIDDGKLTESGTHAELIEKKGTFFTLMELQTKALAMRGLE